MKNIRFVVSLALFFLYLSTAWGQTITSTTAGGDWQSPITWIGNTVPNSSDNVAVQGPVQGGGSCLDLSILPGGGLSAVGNSHVYVNGYFHNMGSVVDGGGVLYIHLLGSTLLNDGLMDFYKLTLERTAEQYLFHAIANPLQIDIISDTHAGSSLIAGNRLHLQNTQLQLNGTSLLLASSGQLVLEGGEVSDGTVMCNSSTLIITGKLKNIALTDPILEGTVSVEGYLQLTNAVNHATIEPTATSTGNQNLRLYQQFTNHGIIRNLDSTHLLTTSCYCDIWNYGIWGGYKIDLATTTPLVFADQSPSGFNPGSLTGIPGSKLIMLTNLVFSDTFMNLSSVELQLFWGTAGKTLYLQGGGISGGTLSGVRNSCLYGSGGATLTGGLTVSEIETRGEWFVTGTPQFGILRNYGQLANPPGGALGSIHVYNLLVNAGIIAQNYTGPYTGFSVNLYGDLVNLGSYSVYLKVSGTNSQRLSILASDEPTLIRILSDRGAMVDWYVNGIISTYHGELFTVGYHSAYFAGSYQAYGFGAYGRVVYISLDAGFPPQQSQISMQSGVLAFSWDQMPGAAGYRIYSSNTVNGAFNDVEVEEITDANLSDGTVQYTLPIGQDSRKFYRVVGLY